MALRAGIKLVSPSAPRFNNYDGEVILDVDDSHWYVCILCLDVRASEK